MLSLDLFLMFDFVEEFFVVDNFVGWSMFVSMLIYVSSLVNVFWGKIEFGRVGE